MQTYDFIMLGVLAGTIIFGAWRGLAWQLASISALVVSFFVACQFRHPVSKFLSIDPPWNRLAAMLIIYLACSIVIWLAFGYVRKIIEQVKLKDFDRHAGALLGAINGVILCTIITLFAVTLTSDQTKNHICRSRSGYYIAKMLDRVTVAMPPEVHDAIGPYLKKLDEQLEHDHTGPEFGGGEQHANSHQNGFPESVTNAASGLLQNAKGTFSPSPTTGGNGGFFSNGEGVRIGDNAGFPSNDGEAIRIPR